MKNIGRNVLGVLSVATCLVAFTFQGGSIKGKITPADGATQVWALSPTDTLKAIINGGAFDLQNARAGTYKVYIDAKDPYKDVIKEGVQVTDGGVADLGDIVLQK